MKFSIYYSYATLILVASVAFQLVTSEPLKRYPNVCNETVLVKKEKLVNVPVHYKIEMQGICGILPCTKHRYETRMDSKIEQTFEEVVKTVCCPGYTETPDRRCEPICLRSCLHGRCVAPDTCKCYMQPSDKSPGFEGPTCARYVCGSPNKWGPNCDKECSSECPPTAYCSAYSGKCLCRPGWRGANCTDECDSTSNCDEVELPPIIEPEANVIDDTLTLGSSISQTQKLVSQGRSMLSEFDNVEEANSLASLVTTLTTVTIFCLLLTCILIFSLFYYKKRLNQLREHLYGPYSTTGSQSSSSSQGSDEDNVSHIYSTISTHPSIPNRPRMPTPLEREYLGKNLSFAAATRNMLNTSSDDINGKGSQNDTNNIGENRKKLILDPKTESHLISSQRSSEANIYSDITQDNTRAPTTKALTLIPEETVLDLPRDGASAGAKQITLRVVVDNDDEDNVYQVPRSPALRATEESNPITQISGESSSLLNEQIYETLEPNIYDEIRRKSTDSSSQQ